MLLQKHSIVGQYSFNSNDPASFIEFLLKYMTLLPIQKSLFEEIWILY